MAEHDFSKVEEFVKQFVADKRSGDVAVILGNKDREIYRFYHSSRGDVLNGQTLFNMMSVTKIMATAPIFHKLMEEGRVDYNDPLGKYFPEATEDKKDIPLWMLLAHVSGIERYQFPDYYGPDRRSEAIDFIFSKPLIFEPNSRYQYSCANFLLLGFLCERLYNKPLNLLFDDMIARPLGMKNSMYLPREDENIITGTVLPPLGANKCSDMPCRKLYGIAGNAGIFSCPDDMSIFGRSLLNKHSKLLSEEIFDIAAIDRTPTHSMGRSLGYVHVDGRYAAAGKLLSDGSIGHTGFSGTSVYADFKNDLYVSILSNTAVHAFVAKKDCSRECNALRIGVHNAIADALGIQSR